MHSRNGAGGKKKGCPRIQYIDIIKKWTKASLRENVRQTEDHGVNEVVQLERLTSELTTPTNVK